MTLHNWSSQLSFLYHSMLLWWCGEWKRDEIWFFLGQSNKNDYLPLPHSFVPLKLVFQSFFLILHEWSTDVIFWRETSRNEWSREDEPKGTNSEQRTKCLLHRDHFSSYLDPSFVKYVWRKPKAHRSLHRFAPLVQLFSAAAAVIWCVFNSPLQFFLRTIH